MNKVALLSILLLFIEFNSYAWQDPTVPLPKRKEGHQNSLITKAANCSPSTGRKVMEFNNVSALIETGGSMWLDRSRGKNAYEVPKGSGNTLIYIGGLWMGGMDVNNQLKIAALRYRIGNDFWTGPLSMGPNGQTGNINQGTLDYGAATIEPETCLEYDQFFITTRSEVELFNSWYECSKDPDCDVNIDFPNYQIPASILTWPAHGDIGKFHDFNLAPFYDRPGGTPGIYDPIGDGDYPWYDLSGEIDCRTNRKVTLYGDFNMWWVFNDKGNIHTETGGDPIGMEIRSQAFAFATNDEINSMTFYNYELINRSTQTLTNTYFGVYLDCDIGCSFDDYVGCDVERGLGYAYNGNAIDAIGCGSWTTPIGANPPAMGVDFFEGPYQDNDGLDNPLTSDVSQAIQDRGIPYQGLGIGYGDGVIDNERFGMKRFVYYDGQLNQTTFGDPTNAVEYYNYMRGYWRDNTRFVYGATGNSSSSGASNIPTNYCFPGDSDPLNWGTEGINPGFFWSEQTPGSGSPNPVGDRRFVQAAGPFELRPGALNNITFGVVYGRANSGDPFQSVNVVRRADDKAQALFDNCFRLLNGPDSPEMVIQELDKELILHLNKTIDVENYEEVDPIITALDTCEPTPCWDDKYRFQGYQVYQVADGSVDPSELQDVDRARLISQCDVKDGVTQLVNFDFDDAIQAAVPTEMVDGADDGIRHSYQVTNDAFAQGDVRLINHKKYYFMVLAYGYNNYKTYDPSNPTALDGQQKPYKAGRKSVNGGSITAYVGIPHIPVPELGGTVQMVEYGSGPKLTRVEGRGNGRNLLELTAESEQEIVEQYTPQLVTYENGFGPVDVKVIDPLNVKGGDYGLKILGYGTNISLTAIDTATWVLTRTYDGVTDTITSDMSISVGNEQLIPEWGISVNIEQYHPESVGSNMYLPENLISSVEYADSSKRWLIGIEDADGSVPQNWIRSGTATEDADATLYPDFCDDPASYNDYVGVDDLETKESILDGTFAPYRMVASGDCHHEPVTSSLSGTIGMSDMKYLMSVDVVITADRSKWTRCPVLETQDNPDLSWNGNTDKQDVKLMPSIDKYGNPTNNPSGSSTNPEDANYISGEGMGWFPGYAIDVTSGERLNIAYGEDSWLGNNGGKDMMFNPSANWYTNFGEALFGGKHYIYVFRNASKDPNSWDQGNMPAYDAGQHFMDNWSSTAQSYKIWRSCSWVGFPVLNSESSGGFGAQQEPSPSDPSSFIETDVKLRLRTAGTYFEMGDGIAGWSGPNNDWDPYYTFKMDDIAVINNDLAALDSACQLMNVVPNPYYAYSNYEFNKLDNVVKIVNLPDQCTVKIYTVSGTLVRTYKKDSPVTSIDWDLKNYAGIPIASGVYLIHVNIPGGCEKVMKWFGVVRPPDLDNF